VPDFTQPEVKAFYTEYSNNLIKIIKAIREKNETKAVALMKNPGKQLNDKRIKVEKKVVMNPVEKKKWMEYAAQVYPLIKELERSPYYQKLAGGK